MKSRPESASSDGRKLTRLAGVCTTGTCPTVFLQEPGTLLVQGYTVPPDEVGVDLSEGESLVTVPLDLVVKAIQELRSDRRYRTDLDGF
jgi:hypothetical protein